MKVSVKKHVLLPLLLGIIVLLAYWGLITYDNDFPYGRMRETPAVRPHEQVLPTMPEGIVPSGGGEEILRATDAVNLTSPLAKGDPADLELGKARYFTYCAQCHGKDYDGNGTVGQSFYPLPTDLRSQKVQFLSEGSFFKEISYGIPNGRQPALAATISVEDRWRIVAYVRSLGLRR